LKKSDSEIYEWLIAKAGVKKELYI